MSGFQLKSLEEESASSGDSFSLSNNDVVSFVKKDLKIFVRKSEAPPKVKAAPVLRRDDDFKKYLSFIMIFTVIALGAISTFEVNDELEKEKLPERVAKILYKRKKISKAKTLKKKPVEKPKKKKVLSKPKVVEKKKEVVKKQKPKFKPKTAAPQKKKKVVKSKVVRKRKGTLQTTARSAQKNRVKKSVSKKAPRHVDTYKSKNFKSSISSLLSKRGGGEVVAKSAKVSSGINNLGLSGTTASASSPSVVKVSKNIGRLAKGVGGKLDSTIGTKGIANKKDVYSQELPFRTVVLGSIDPNIIRQILAENVSQFRSCYQDYLEKSGESLNKVIKLNFLIGSSGFVTRAGLEAEGDLDDEMSGCMVNVLKGIQFPKLVGGGVAEVSQPFNFYTTRN